MKSKRKPKEIKLVQLIEYWLNSDEALSKHFNVEYDSSNNGYIMERCKRDAIIRSPMASRAYVYIRDSFVELYEYGYMSGKELHSTTPSFFILLREFLCDTHNKASWCREVV